MSAESERVFGKVKSVGVSEAEADYFDLRLKATERLFFSAFKFLADPGDGRVRPHPYLKLLSNWVVDREDRTEVLVNPHANLDYPIIHELDEDYTQVQLPTDYLELADRSPTDILFHAVYVGSKLRDLSHGWDIEQDDSEARAKILQSEFIRWWEDASIVVGVTFDERDEHIDIRQEYPRGFKSHRAAPYMASLRLPTSTLVTEDFTPIERSLN